MQVQRKKIEIVNDEENGKLRLKRTFNAYIWITYG